MATTDVDSTKAVVREWIDRHTICLANESGNGDVGFAGLLYESCLGLFKDIYTQSRKSSVLSKDDQRQLKEELGRLFLWGDAFRDGKLDRVLVQWGDLRMTILEFISGIGKVLTSSESGLKDIKQCLNAD